jgi:DnaK suppressor protein
MKAIMARAREQLQRRKEALLRLEQAGSAGQKVLVGGAPSAGLAVGMAQAPWRLCAQLSEHERFELVEIDAALERLEHGTYGACQTCGGPIGKQRLMALPEARLCIACREGSERNAL